MPVTIFISNGHSYKSVVVPMHKLDAVCGLLTGVCAKRTGLYWNAKGQHWESFWRISG